MAHDYFLKLAVGAAAFAIVLALGGAASASSAVKCVQQELGELHFEPGPADGEIGGKTRAAAKAYAAQAMGRELPPLDAISAMRWCRWLAADHPELKSLYTLYRGTNYPAFDPAFQLAEARRQWLFDDEYYLSQVPDPKSVNNPRAHYNSTGWKLGYDPSVMFDTSAYLEANPDVAATGENPFTHYVKKGMDEGRGFGLTPDESGYIFDIGPKVPDKDVALVKRGLVISQEYLARVFGRPVPPEVMARIVVKLEATGKGNQELGSRGGDATGLSNQNDHLPRPYFDVGSKAWSRDVSGRGWTIEAERLAKVGHEFGHGWQNWLGALSVYEQPLGNWMNEGIANYIGWIALVDLGMVSLDDFERYEVNAAMGSSQLDSPLETFGTSVSDVWPGDIGYLAIDWLVDSSPNGQMSLLIVAEELGRSRETKASLREVFLKAFGLELADFYTQFEPWRKALRANPRRALANRPTLLLEKDI